MREMIAVFDVRYLGMNTRTSFNVAIAVGLKEDHMHHDDHPKQGSATGPQDLH